MTASFNRQNLKKTVRRSAGDGRTYIYPHRIANGPAARGREVRAQLAIAIRYFETMVGQRRAALDPEALVALFGDHKLARGLVAAMARYYRYRPLQYNEVVPVTVVDTLFEPRLGTPAALRANLFRFLNTAPRAGFATEGDRADILSDFGADLGLDPEQLADLLWLDGEEHWVLTRLATPDPADLIALYDFLALETVLRYASKLELEFRTPVAAAVGRDLRLLLGYYGLQCDLEEERAGRPWRVTLHGRADARGSWARHGKRLVRVLVRLLTAHPGCLESGEAQIELGNASTVLRMDAAVLAQLGAVSDGTGADVAPVLTPAACADLRAAGLPSKWALRIDPEPLVYAGGVLAPLALCMRQNRRVYLLPVESPAALDRIERALPHLRGRADLLLLAAPGVASPEGRAPAPLLVRGPDDALDLRAVIALLEQHWGQDVPAPAVTEDISPLAALLGRVRREGLVPAGEALAVLGEAPAAGPLPGGRGVEYIPEVGLCSAGFLARVRELIDAQLEFFAGRLVTLPQPTATLALNLPGAEAVGNLALEKLVAALPDYVIVPRKLFDPYVRPLSHVTGSAATSAAATAALSRAA
jgi:predicted nuclease of restriction endonuclease-like RecB superfamily